MTVFKASGLLLLSLTLGGLLPTEGILKSVVDTLTSGVNNVIQTSKDIASTALKIPEMLKDATGGKLMDTMCKLGSEGRQGLAKAYNKANGQSLLSAINVAAIPKMTKNLLTDMTRSFSELDAIRLRKAVDYATVDFWFFKIPGTDEEVLNEILPCRNNRQMKWITTAYSLTYNKKLEDDIRGDTSGTYKDLLDALMMANRTESTDVDDDQAEKDSELLYEAGSGRFFGTDEEKFIEIFTQRGKEQLAKTFEVFEAKHGHSIEKELEEEFSGDARDGLVAVARCVKDDTGYFADVLLKQVTDPKSTRLGSAMSTLLSLPTDKLQSVKAAFKDKTGLSLQQHLKDNYDADKVQSHLCILGDEQ